MSTYNKELLVIEEDEIIFLDYEEFKPTIIPTDMLLLGVFGGAYYNDPEVCDQMPQELFKGVPGHKYILSKPYKEANRFKVLAGKPREWWEERNLINHQYDTEGWFQWYCRFFYGRRCPDDERQIKRWKSFYARHTKGFLSRVNKRDNPKQALKNPNILSKYKQSLTQWAIDPLKLK